ncbi:type II toxin-antitoxin system RelE/ParE family toxin [Lichenibacterium dinghuense]|uniref:type II toxin-antitoxin system RelE/ParE family toxin n=1 Tax=Lichenibacterium dinghuense TaxID=2895977 RepID=UPI001F359B3B|nr:type II toxin-antitoxin system RelE/ParE family toxin [Lichenibacterium sp. 6Y81]
MVEVRSTPTFVAWLDALADITARSRIAKRIARFEVGLFGDVKSVGGGVSEVRVDYGPGYRVYFTRRGAEVVILLCGGDKGSQARDIARAQSMVLDL